MLTTHSYLIIILFPIFSFNALKNINVQIFSGNLSFQNTSQVLRALYNQSVKNPPGS